MYNVSAKMDRFSSVAQPWSKVLCFGLPYRPQLNSLESSKCVCRDTHSPNIVSSCSLLTGYPSRKRRPEPAERVVKSLIEQLGWHCLHGRRKPLQPRSLPTRGVTRYSPSARRGTALRLDGIMARWPRRF